MPVGASRFSARKACLTGVFALALGGCIVPPFAGVLGAPSPTGSPGAGALPGNPSQGPSNSEPEAREWFKATFKASGETNADVSPFDTVVTIRGREVNSGVFSIWRNKDDRGNPYPDSFVLQASPPSGDAPSAEPQRLFEIRFGEVPSAHGVYAIASATTGPTSVRVMYQQDHRLTRDIWTAASGRVEVTSSTEGRLRLQLNDLRMVPELHAETFESKATGEIVINASSEFVPKDEYGRAGPVVDR